MTGIIGKTGASSGEVGKTSTSLGNVENTALSTWAGTTNITTLGTVNAGTLNDTVAYRSINQDLATSDSPTFAALTADSIPLHDMPDHSWLSAPSALVGTNRTLYHNAKTTGGSLNATSNQDRINVNTSGAYWFDTRQRVAENGAGHMGKNDGGALYAQDYGNHAGDHDHGGGNHAYSHSRSFGYMGSSQFISAHHGSGQYGAAGSAYNGTFIGWRVR